MRALLDSTPAKVIGAPARHPRASPRRSRWVVGAAVLLASLSACSSPAGHDSQGQARTAAQRSPRPAATLTGPITIGEIEEPVTAEPFDLAAGGYVEQEFFASGTADSYSFSAKPSNDGKWAIRPDASAFYRTRIVVRRPADPSRFNGTVLVEWLNVSGGIEASPDWTYLSPEIMHDGYAYVAVSAQSLGVMGGQGLLAGSPSGGLRTQEPARYGTLVHPGDAFSYDMFTQIGNALRAPGGVPVLGHLVPKHVIAVGESQSAFYLTTYADAIQPTSRTFDGFFIHSRAGGAGPLDGKGFEQAGLDAVHIRDDLDVPVFVFETETDVGPLLDYGPARQPDTDRFRAWEVAGTSHADAYIAGVGAGLLGCGSQVNEGPERFVAQAALDALDRWVTDGTPPPEPPRLKLASTRSSVIARDSLGIAIGGVRTPPVDVPVATLSGNAAPGSSVVCALFGSTRPFDAATLLRLYHDRAGYLVAYTRSLDRAIKSGYLLRDQRSELLSEAESVAF